MHGTVHARAHLPLSYRLPREPDAEECHADREQRRVFIREDGFFVTKDLYPNRRAEDHQYHCGNQPQPATHHRATSGQFRPVHRKQNDREVTARCDGKRQAYHEGDVLILKQHAEDNGNHT